MDIASQARAMSEGALVRALPELATLIVTGSERQSWLAGMLTQDISDLRPGQGAYALSVNKNGRIHAEVWVAMGEERILMGVDKSVADTLLAEMDRFLIMEDAELSRAGEPLSWWLAHGPQAEAVVKAARSQHAVAALTRWGEIDTAIIIAPHGGAPNMAEVLTSAPGAVLATPEGWERVRIERMLPRFGVDFEAGMYPQQATLEHLAVSFNKGCYVGQEAVFMLQKRGHVNKRLIRLVLTGERELPRGTPVTTPEGEKVGEITSSVTGDGQTFALAMVRYKHTLSGTKLAIDGHGAEVSCLSEREGGCA